ncbi:MAG: hypothetical protein ETSY2_53770 [Candidatus Entotheonella gemina]|uniref:Uncharacterized protein n=1 Tax=Candidatus Entotheonella gemina TaxID=1429439 RepID=W4L2M2_9BACT|nr:MAG: hypothetical protein ETSY2_53770 [Candidatus Entotheonella gemina]
MIVELDSLPAEEFGRLNGIVVSKALVPTEDGNLINVKLTEPVKTDYGYELPVVAELYGKAKIITKDKRLLTRFFDKLLYLTNQG